MGLDMYAYAVPEKLAEGDFSFKQGDIQVQKIAYWRKHHNLHGWMEKLYKEKGGTEEFNCIPLRLEQVELLDLILAIKGESLPETEGFFFGNHPPDDETMKEDLAFANKALSCINKGLVIYYYSWW
jgi:hypothetical protein